MQMRPSVSNANPHSREYSATVEKSQTDTNTHDIYGADVGASPSKTSQECQPLPHASPSPRNGQMTPSPNLEMFLFFGEVVLSKFDYTCACGEVEEVFYCDVLLLVYLDIICS